MGDGYGSLGRVGSNLKLVTAIGLISTSSFVDRVRFDFTIEGPRKAQCKREPCTHSPEPGPMRFQNGRRNGYSRGGVWLASVLKPGQVSVEGMGHESGIHATDPSTEPCRQTLMTLSGTLQLRRRPTMASK